MTQQDKEFKLLRIMKGRLNYRRGDLSLFILEPNQSIYFDSIEVYEEAYNNAYMKNVFLEDEVRDLLLECGLWTPFDDQIMEQLKKEIDDIKVQAFNCFFNKNQLSYAKMKLRAKELEYAKLSMQKHQYDKYTCENVANLARWNWIIENSTYYRDTNKLYDWKHVNVSNILAYYEDNSISPSEFREIARNDPWRSTWAIGKKTGNIFPVSSSEYTKDQIALSSYSMMYDSVYESPEQPDEGIIADDDCLDGWFIEQKRKMEKSKIEREVESKLTNSKIANSNEVFVLAQSDLEANRVNSVNPPHVEQLKKQRMAVIKEKGFVTDNDFADVKMDKEMKATQAFVNNLTKG